MSRTQKHILSIAATAAMLALLLTACVHEYPEPGKEVDPTLIDLTINLSTDPSVTQQSIVKESIEYPAYTRFVMEVYRNEATGEPLLRQEIGAATATDGSAEASFSFALHAGTYKLVAFAAYADAADGTGIIYDYTRLDHIVIADDTYPGGDIKRQCYDLRRTLEYPPTGDWFVKETIDYKLSSPVGRVEVVAADAEAFVTKVLLQTASTSVIETMEDEAFWQNYLVNFAYSLYFPTGYNVLTGLPNLSETGIQYSSSPVYLGNAEALLGYDYVFVNGDETTVTMTIAVQDITTGEIVNSNSGISATVPKAQTVVIKDNFLTIQKGSGIGINPDFDGTIDIVLPD